LARVGPRSQPLALFASASLPQKARLPPTRLPSHPYNYHRSMMQNLKKTSKNCPSILG
jgi:hypothetical protein